MKIAKIEITNSIGHPALDRNFNFIGDFLFITTDKSDKRMNTYLYLNGDGRIEHSSESFDRKRGPSRHHTFKTI